MISDAVKRLIAAAQAAVDEYTSRDHTSPCTCAGCMLDHELQRVTAPCKTCGTPKWRHLTNHKYEE